MSKKKSKKEKEEEKRKEEASTKIEYPKYLYNVILLGLCLSGMAALIYEVAWTRLLQLVFGTTVYAVSTMLTAFMAGLALGSWLVGKYTDKIKNHLRAFCLLEAGIGIYGVLLIPVFSVLPYAYLGLFHAFQSSFRVFSFFQFLLCFLILLIPTTLMGGTFPVVSKIYTKRMEELGKDIGNVYSINNLGAVLGSFAAGFLFIPFIGVKNTIIAAASLNIFVAILIAILSRERNGKGKGMIFMSSLCVILLLGVAMPGYGYDVKILNTALYQRAGMYASGEEFKKDLEDMHVLYYKEGLYGTVIVTESKSYGIRSLMLNGKPDASTTREDMTTQLLLGYVPLILHEHPKNVLIIGLGGGFTLEAAENFDDVENIDVVEIDPLVVEAEKFFSAYNKNALDDERVNLIIADARNYLLTTDEKYDVIISEPSDPWISGACSNLFTKEFFELSTKHLNEEGIFLQWVPIYDVSVSDFRTLLNTFSKVYDHSMLWTATDGGDMLFAGSKSPIEMNCTRLGEYLSKKHVKDDLGSIGIQNAEDFLAKNFVMNEEETEGFTEGALLNTDDKPIIEFSAPITILRSNDPLNLRKDISSYKAKIGKPFYIPPVKGLEAREGEVSRLGFMGLNVRLCDGWKGETFGLVVNKTYREAEGGGPMIDLEVWKEAKYSSPKGKIKIIGLKMPVSPTKEELANFLGVSSIELEQGTVGTDSYQAYFIYDADAENELLTAVWFCEKSSHLYIAEITYPKKMQEEVENILSGFECINIRW